MKPESIYPHLCESYPHFINLYDSLSIFVRESCYLLKMRRLNYQAMLFPTLVRIDMKII